MHSIREIINLVGYRSDFRYSASKCRHRMFFVCNRKSVRDSGVSYTKTVKWCFFVARSARISPTSDCYSFDSTKRRADQISRVDDEIFCIGMRLKSRFHIACHLAIDACSSSADLFPLIPTRPPVHPQYLREIVLYLNRDVTGVRTHIEHTRLSLASHQT